MKKMLLITLFFALECFSFARSSNSCEGVGGQPSYTVNFMWTGNGLRIREAHLHPNRRVNPESQDVASHENLGWHLCEWAEVEGPLSINLWYHSGLLASVQEYENFKQAIDGLKTYIRDCNISLVAPIMMRHGEQDCGLQNPLLGDMNFYENGFQIIRTRNAVCAKLILEQIILPAVRDVSDPEVFSNIWGGGIWHRYGALFSSLLPKPLGDLQRRESSDWKLLVPTKYMPFIEPSDYHVNPDK